MKKAQAYGFWIATLGFALGVLLIIFPTFVLNPSKNNEYAGATSTALLRASYDAQEKLNFVDQAGAYALYDALRNLAWNGGFGTQPDPCGKHLYPLWSSTSRISFREESNGASRDKFDSTLGLYLCYPEEIKNLETQYPTEFVRYLQQSTYPYPSDNYNYTYRYEKKTELLAKARNNLITQAELNDQNYANLLIKPSYRVEYPHTLYVYDRIKEWVQETLERCYDDPPRCLQEAVQQHNDAEDMKQEDSFILSTDCPETFDGLVEKYADCAWTAQNDCVCSIPIDPSQKMKIEFNNERVVLSQPYYQEYPALIPVAFGSYAGDVKSAERYTFDTDGEKNVLTVYQEGVEIKKIDYPEMILYKQKEGMVLLEKPRYADESAVPICTLNKTRSKVCARTSQELPYVRPGRVEWKNVSIQFALELQDRTPPYVYIEVRDEPSTHFQTEPPNENDLSEGLLIQWDQARYEDSTAAEDIDHYLIYCSQGIISKGTSPDSPTYALVFDERKQVTYYTGEKTISVPVLQRIPRENHYVITLEGCGPDAIHDDLKLIEPLYQVYVTTVDKNGNEMKERLEPVQACPSSYYLEHPPTVDPTGVLTLQYQTYLASVRSECWLRA